MHQPQHHRCVHPPSRSVMKLSKWSLHVSNLLDTAPAGAAVPRVAQWLKTTRRVQTAPEWYPESFVVIVGLMMAILCDIICNGNTIWQNLTTRLSMVTYKCVNLEPHLGYNISNQPHITCHVCIIISYRVQKQTIQRRENCKVKIKLQKVSLTQLVGFTVKSDLAVGYTSAVTCKPTTQNRVYIRTVWSDHITSWHNHWSTPT